MLIALLVVNLAVTSANRHIQLGKHDRAIAPHGSLGVGPGHSMIKINHLINLII